MKSVKMSSQNTIRRSNSSNDDDASSRTNKKVGLAVPTAVAAAATTTISDACQKEWHRYRQLFPSVAYMTSLELQDILADDSKMNDVVLIDVRTKAEQSVSMLPGAISFDEWKETGDLSKIVAKQGEEFESPSTKIVLYCTIGYRSGVEAQRLKDQHPFLDVFSLDGIVPFTHCNHTDTMPLIQKQTNGKSRATKRVHVYGPAWQRFVHPEFDPVVFSKLDLAIQRVLKGFKQIVKRHDNK